MSESIQTAREDHREEALKRLTADEHVTLDKYERQGGRPIAADWNQRLYELYLRGLTCEAISLLTPGLSLGAVLKARVDGFWDERRDQYTAELLTETNGQVRQTAAEALQFLSLVLAVAHKEHGQKLKKYLSTGNPEDLGDFRILNFGQYKTIIETIARLLGADTKKTVTHRFIGGAPVPGGAPEADVEAAEAGGIVGAVGGRFMPVEAAAMRRALLQARGEQKREEE